MCKISIVIPVYNNEKYLDDCITSVLAQDYSDFELILVDDGSTDNSLAVCQSYVGRDERIKVYTKPNSGVSNTRNFGISKAEGEYVTFIDSDDYISKDYCSSLLEHMTPDVGIVVLGLQKVFPDGRVVPIRHRFSGGNYSFNDIEGKIIDDGTLSGFSLHSSCAVLFKLELIRKNSVAFNDKVRYNEDGLFNIEYVLKSKCNVYIDYSKCIYFYRTNLESATTVADLFSDRYVQSMTNIENVLSKYISEFQHVEKQIRRRAATISLSRLISLAQKNALNTKKTKELLRDKSTKEGFKALDYSSMDRDKKAFCLVVKMKNFWIITKVLQMRFGKK